MKHIVYSLLVLWVLGTNMAGAAPKHRHHTLTTAVADSVALDEETDEGIEAFSDTTAVAAPTTPDEDAIRMDDDDDFGFSSEDWLRTESLLSHIENVTGSTLGIVAIIFIICFCLFLFFLLPLLVVIWLLRHLVKRHNRRVEAQEQAMAANAAMPDTLENIAERNREETWQRGVRNTSIGIGLTALFYIMGADSMVGIGVLLACLGIGQIIIARASKKKNGL